ncbi:2-hydroxyacid dehydrogenase [Nesterenkonia ebinurensis]|uniref:2-hydroxyacid dehydrogenase n=1 Tax=Nesterenkonia ebinurensis TaxID=2608252 RepID=UPI00123D5F0E|nr:D-glycerate dehydrogenase [Nesterenkonia ebinurensis]
MYRSKITSPRFLVTLPLPDPGMEILHRTGDVTVLEEPPVYEELVGLCASCEFDVLVSQLSDRLDARLLERAYIKGISNYAVGFNNIDVPAATAGDILVANTPGILTDATADLAVLLMLGTARRVVEGDQLTRSGSFTGWKPDLLLGTDISGRILGLAGFGRIGRAVAQRAAGFNMRILYCRRPPSQTAEETSADIGELADKVEAVGWDEVVETSDFLSLHVPLVPETHHLINAETLRRMKDSAILINTARGAVVDEAALVAALRASEIAAAGLDVYEAEPELHHGLSVLSNTLLLPHVGSATASVRSEMARVCAENAAAIGRGDLPPHPVNPEAWERAAG